MDLQRLQQLSQSVKRPKYQLGQIAEITPETHDSFESGTLGLILAVHAFNDDEEPYTAYRVQIEDQPPSENNDYFDGFDYDNVECIFEHQIVSIIA